MKKILAFLMAVVLMAMALASCDFAGSEGTIEEEELFDYKGFTVTAKELDYDGVFGAELKLKLDNDTSNDYRLSVDKVIVNNCMSTALFSKEVLAGDTSTEGLELNESTLKRKGISNIGKIEILFDVLDYDTYATLYSEWVTIKTSIYSDMDTEVDTSGEEIYDDDGIIVKARYSDVETIWGTAVVLYIENEYGDDIHVNVDKLSINGCTVNTALMGVTVLDDKIAVYDADIYTSFLEDNDIDKVETVKISISITNSRYSTIGTSRLIEFDA